MFKPLALGAVLSCSIPALSQTSPADSLVNGLAHLFQYLDPDSIPSGRLYDRGLTLGNPAEITRADSAVETSLVLFGMAYQSMATAQFNGRAAIPEYHTLLTQSETYPENTVPMFFMDLSFNYLKDNALANGQVRMENGAIIPFGPYSQILSAARGSLLAPARHTAVGPQVTFALPTAFWVDDAGQQAATLQLNFGNGDGWQDIAAGGNLQTTFTGEAGQREIQYRILAGSIVRAIGTFKVFVEMGMMAITSSPPEVFPSTTYYSGARGHVVYCAAHNPQPQPGQHVELFNPVIVLEGWDPKQVAPLLIDNNMTWEKLSDVIGPVINDIGFDHDILYIDWGVGTDAIERNAALLEDVLAYVNSHKRPGDQNIVIGHSMGGLVARYALSKMAKEGRDSQTRLLITHDSPHQGANMPVGLQYVARKLLQLTNEAVANSPTVRIIDAIFPLRGQGAGVLNAPATRQMLLHWIDASGNLVPNTWLQQVYWPMVDFGGWSTPPPFQMVATSQGSECGVKDYTPGFEILSYQGSLTAKFNPILTLMGPKKWEMKVQINGALEGGGNQVASLKLTYQRTLFGMFTVSINAIDFKKNCPTGPFYVDDVPGGYINTDYGQVPAISFDDPVFFNVSSSISRSKGFTFIPTKSALDVAGNTAAVYNRGYNPWNPSPPNSRITTFRASEPVAMVGGTTDRNGSHMNMTALQGLFVVNVIRSQPLTNMCPQECMLSGYLEGPDQLCPVGLQGPGQYSINLPANGFTYAWNANNAVLNSVANESTASFFIEPNSTAPTALIFCEVSRGGCTRTLTKTIDATTDVPDIVVTCNKNGYHAMPGDAICQGIFHQSQPGNFRWLSVESIDVGGYHVDWEALPDNSNPPRYPTLDPLEINGTQKTAKVWANGVSQLSFKVRVEKQGSGCGSKEKTVVMPYNYLSPWGDACIACHNAQWVVVSPSRLVREADQHATLSLPGSVALPGMAFIKDSRGQTLVRFEVVAFETVFSTEDILPATYTVDYKGPDGTYRTHFIVVNSNAERLSLSPNPAFDKVDNHVEVRLLADSAVGDSVAYQLETFGGTPLQSWYGGAITSFPLHGLTAGTYVVRATWGSTSVQQDVDFILNGEPYITLAPNPTAGRTTVTLHNPVYPICDPGPGPQENGGLQFNQGPGTCHTLQYTVSNATTTVGSGTATAEVFDVDLTSLPSGVYTLSVSDGLATYGKHVQVVH